MDHHNVALAVTENPIGDVNVAASGVFDRWRCREGRIVDVRFGASRRLPARFAHHCDEAIALGGDGDYEPRRIRVVMQRTANLPHPRVDGVVGIEEDPFAPDALKDFFARNQLIAPVDKQEQQVERNPFQLERTALAPKL